MPPQTRRARACAVTHTSHNEIGTSLEGSMDRDTQVHRSSQHRGAVVTNRYANLEGESRTSFSQAYLTQ